MSESNSVKKEQNKQTKVYDDGDQETRKTVVEKQPNEESEETQEESDDKKEDEEETEASQDDDDESEEKENVKVEQAEEKKKVLEADAKPEEKQEVKEQSEEKEEEINEEKEEEKEEKSEPNNEEEEEVKQEGKKKPKTFIQKLLGWFIFPFLPLLLVFRDSSRVVKIKLREGKEKCKEIKKKIIEIGDLTLKDIFMGIVNFYVAVFKKCLSICQTLFNKLVIQVISYVDNKLKISKRFNDLKSQFKLKNLVEGLKNRMFAFVKSCYDVLSYFIVHYVIVYLYEVLDYVLGAKNRMKLVSFVESKSLAALKYAKNLFGLSPKEPQEEVVEETPVEAQ